MDISSISHLTPLATTGAVPADQRALIKAVRAVDAAQQFGPDHELTFAIDRESGRAVVRLLNRKTGDVEQIPAEYVLRLAEELKGTNTSDK